MRQGSQQLVESLSEFSDLWPPTLDSTTITDDSAPFLIDSMISAADDWLDERAAQFNPFDWESADERYARRKAFAEAAIYLNVAAAHGDTDAAPRLHDLVLEHVLSPDYAELVRRYPRHFLLFSSPIVYAAWQGELTPKLASAVDEVLSGKTVWSTERPPHRMMDLWNFCSAYGRSSLLGPVEGLMSLGAAGLPLDPIEANLRDAYGLTHNLMFLYNFGVLDGSVPEVPTEIEDIGDNLESCLTLLTLRFIAENNFDVALELIMVGALQRRLPRGLLRLVLGWLDAAVKSHGGIPGPNQDENFQLAVEDPDFQSWYGDYHTTLVVASTLRTLRRDWDVLDERLSKVSTENWNPVVAQRVGESLNRLHRYELPLGIAQLQELVPMQESEPVAMALDAAVPFISKQRNDNGHFGLFTDERRAHDHVIASEESFESIMVQPVSELATQFLELAALR